MAIEDQKNVAEAIRLDEARDVVEALAGDHVGEVESSDKKGNDINDGCPGDGGAELLSYAELHGTSAP